VIAAADVADVADVVAVAVAVAAVDSVLRNQISVANAVTVRFYQEYVTVLDIYMRIETAAAAADSVYDSSAAGFERALATQQHLGP